MFGGAPQGNGQNEDGFYELQATDNVDPDPLVNTASVTCTVAGFPNVLEAKRQPLDRPVPTIRSHHQDG